MFNFWDWHKDGAVLEGVYIGQQAKVGAFKKNVLAFRLDNGKVVHTWATAALNVGIYGIPFKSRLKITFKGMGTMPDTGYPFMDFDIEVIGPPPDEEIKT